MYLIALLSIAIHSCYIGSKVVVSLLALELGASQLLIGVLAALYALLPMLLGVYSGRLADTIGMRVPMLIGAALAGIAMLCGFAWQQLAALFATATLMSAAFVFYNVSIQNLTGAHGRPEQRARNFSILTIGYSVSTFIGPMVAGFSIDYAGHGRAFLVFALLTLLPIAALTFYPQLVRVPLPKPERQERRAIDLLRDPPLRSVIVMSGLMTLSFNRSPAGRTGEVTGLRLTANNVARLQDAVDFPAAGPGNHMRLEILAPLLVRCNRRQLVPSLIELVEVLDKMFRLNGRLQCADRAGQQPRLFGAEPDLRRNLP